MPSWASRPTASHSARCASPIVCTCAIGWSRGAKPTRRTEPLSTDRLQHQNCGAFGRFDQGAALAVEIARQLRRQRHLELAQSRDVCCSVGAFEYQQRRIESAAPVKTKIEAIAGQGQMRKRCILLG